MTPTLTLHGLLTRPPTELPPRPGFDTPAKLISVLDEDGGDVFQLVASDEAAAVLASAATPCRVTLGLRARTISLGELTNGATKGRAYRLRVLTASIDGAGKGR